MTVESDWFDELESDSTETGFSGIVEDIEGGYTTFSSSQISSANFDGGIPIGLVSTTVSDLKIGDYVYWNTTTGQPTIPTQGADVDGEEDIIDEEIIDDYDDVYLVSDLDYDEDGGTGATYTVYLNIEDESVPYTVSGSSSVTVLRESWEEKELGENGWAITSSGNAIFTNIAARGTIEAEDGYLRDLNITGILSLTGDPDLDNEDVSIANVGAIRMYETPLPSGTKWFENPSVGLNMAKGIIVRGPGGKRVAQFPVNGSKSYIAGFEIDEGEGGSTDEPGFKGSSKVRFGTASENITINGNGSSGGDPYKAIFTTLNGVATKYADSSNGFRIEVFNTTKTRLKLKGTLGSMLFDGDNLTVTGAINATSGNFTGDVNITSPGRLIAGNLGTNAVVVSAAGLTGTRSGIPMFYLPTDGSEPVIAGFKVINTGLITPDSQSKTVSGTAGQTTITVSSNTGLYIGMAVSGTGIGSGALVIGISGTTVSLSVANIGTVSGTAVFTPTSNLIVGTLSNNITVRGQTAGSVLPAIFTTIGSVATTAAAGNGFYIGQDGLFRLASSSGSLTINSAGDFLLQGTAAGKSGVRIYASNTYMTGSADGAVNVYGDTNKISMDANDLQVSVKSSGAGTTLGLNRLSGGPVVIGSPAANANTTINGSLSVTGTLNFTGSFSSLNTTGAVVADGNIRSNSSFRASNGTVSTPAYSFVNSTSTGIYLAESGTDKRLNFSRDGYLQFQVLEPSNSTYNGRFNLAGSMELSFGSVQFAGYTVTGYRQLIINGTNATPNYVVSSVSSTRRVKQDIESIQNEINNSRFLELEPVKYRYIKEVEERGEEAGWDYGFIAEDAKDLDLTMLYQTDGDGIPDYFAYDKLPIYLFATVKAQQEKIKELENRLAILEG